MPICPYGERRLCVPWILPLNEKAQMHNPHEKSCAVRGAGIKPCGVRLQENKRSLAAMPGWSPDQTKANQGPASKCLRSRWEVCANSQSRPIKMIIGGRAHLSTARTYPVTLGSRGWYEVGPLTRTSHALHTFQPSLCLSASSSHSLPCGICSQD